MKAGDQVLWNDPVEGTSAKLTVLKAPEGDDPEDEIVLDTPEGPVLRVPRKEVSTLP